MPGRFPQTRWRPAPAAVPTPTVGGGAGALDDVEHLPVPGGGPEDVLPDGEGGVLTGLADGRVVRVDVAGGPVTTLATTGGRPLGLAWLPDGDVLVCDAERGLLRFPREGGACEVLLDTVDGERLVLTNNAAVEPDGTIWFTESTRCNPLSDFVGDVLEHNRSGRLLRRDPGGEVTEVVPGLSFANGVELVGDDVWVAETASYTIHRVPRHGPGAGVATAVIATLPGYPDNLAGDADGTVWAPLPNARNPLADRLVAGPPLLRDLVRRLPASVRPGPTAHAEVVGLAPDGSVRHHLTGTGRACTFLTGARAHDGWLYLGSVEEAVCSVVRVHVPNG